MRVYFSHRTYKLSGPSEVISSDKTKYYGIIWAKRYSRILTFTIVPKEIGIYTLTITIQSEDNTLLSFPFTVQVMSSLYKLEKQKQLEIERKKKEKERELEARERIKKEKEEQEQELFTLKILFL